MRRVPGFANPTMTAVALVAVVGIWFGSRSFHQSAMNSREDWPEVEQYRQFVLPKVAPIVGRELVADLLWVQALVYFGDSKSDHRYLESYFKHIYDLAPKFRRAYLIGATAMTTHGKRATPEEQEIAIKFLERAIVEFPDDFELHWTLGNLYVLDTPAQTKKGQKAQKRRGTEILEKAMRMPKAPPQAKTWAVYHRYKLGQREHAIRSIEQMLLTTDNEKTRKKLLERYQRWVKDPAIVNELQEMRKKFRNEWKKNLPHVAPDFYVLLGPPPPKDVSLESIAPIWELVEIDEDGDPNGESATAP